MLQSSDYEVVPMYIELLTSLPIGSVNKFINLVCHFFMFAINCMI